MKPLSNHLHAFLIVASSSLVIISTASAQTWDGGGADNNWSTSLNWSTDVAPISGATLTFAGTTRRSNSNDLTADTVIGGISFTNNSDGTASQFVVSGNRITLGGNITTTAATGATFTDLISIPILLDGNRTVTTNANHSVSLNGIISETGGAFGLIKAGASALTLAGNNSYTGVTAINVGAIRLAHNNGLGSTVGNTTIAASGATDTARIQFTTSAITTAENIFITGDSERANFSPTVDGGGTLSGAITFTVTGTSNTRGIRLGSATLSGTIEQLTSNRDLVLNGTTINNAINNNGGNLRVYGGGATLKGASGSGIGATLIDQGGTLKIGITNALNTANELNIGSFTAENATFDLASFDQTVRGLTSGSTGTARRVINSVASSVSTLTVGNSTTTSSTFTYSGAIRDNNGTGGTVALVKTGTGSQTLSGTNSTYSGGTTFSGGNLVAGSNAAFGTGSITFSGTAVGLTLNNGINIANNITLGTNSGLGGHGLIKVANGQSATLSGTITITNSPTAGGHFGGTGASTTGVTNITGAINSTVNVVQRSATVVLSGGGSYTQFDALQGTTRLGANNGLSTTATVNIGTSGAATLDLIGFNQTLVGITRSSTSNSATITNSSPTLDSTLTTTGTSTFGGVIQNGANRTTALTVSGGSLTLTGANTYTGATSVSAGTLKLGANNVIGNASKLVIGAGTFDADTRTDTVGSLTVTGAAVVNLGSGAALSFADSKAEDWTGGTLNITGELGATSIRFGDSADDLTSAQLALISVNGSGAGTYVLDSNGYLVVGGAASPYQTWASEKGLTASNQANNLDPDGDGNNNLAEFAFNGNPLSGSDNGKIFLLTEDSDADVDTTKELILTVAVRSGTPAFAGTPTPSAVHPTDGLTYGIEGSVDLNGFPASVTVVPTAITTGLPAAGTGYEYRSFSLDGSNDLSSKGFLRAKVTAP